MSRSHTRPYLSFVAASRNDDHGGAILRRMRMFIQGLDHQAARYGLNAELVLVDWNPPEDKPPLHEVLPKPSNGSHLSIRYVLVPNEVHRRWPNWEKIPFFQMIAKNTGIRRALGDFVICTNVDLLFSDELCNFLSQQKLDLRKMYRSNRCDVLYGVPEDGSVEDQLAYCKKNILRRCGLKSRTVNTFVKEQIKWGLKRLVGKQDSSIPIVDTDACGDFTLLSKEAWEQIRGYPELGMYSIYMDGLGAHAAVSMGYEQLVLPSDHCIFHVEHRAGWMSMSVMEKIMLMQERPFLDYATYCEALRWMWDNHQPLPINNENWGCRQDLFQIIRVSERGTEIEVANA
jgi:hypothetical protein